MMRQGLMARVWWVIAAALVMMGLLAWGFWRLQQDAQTRLADITKATLQEHVKQDLMTRGEALSRLLADALANPLYFHDLNDIGEQIRLVAGEPDVMSILVLDRDGRVVHDGSRDIASYGRPLQAPKWNDKGTQSEWLEDRLQMTRQIRIGDEVIGGVQLSLTKQFTEAAIIKAEQHIDGNSRAVALQLARQLWMPLAGLMGLAVLVAWLVAKGLVHPIRRLAKAAKRIEQQDYSVRLASDRPDEIGDLMRGFDRMSEAIGNHHREIRRMAYADALTGMHNRMFLNEALERAVRDADTHQHQVALLFVDLDDFKRINDTLGHHAGDATLTEMAQRLNQCLDDISQRHPEIDRDLPLISRFGGDEFVALVAGVDAREIARELAEMILFAIRHPVTIENQTLHLCGSVGITVYPDDGRDATVLMKNGDIAMYQAKVHGKNCYRFYTAQLAKRVENRLALEQDLRVAIAEHQIDVAYQPITDLHSGEVLGAEALARWHHPVRGQVQPQEFIPLAEDIGLIEELGLQVLRRACEASAKFPLSPDGRASFISVNVSAKQLRHASFPLQLARILHETGLAPSRLHVELTESTLLDAAPIALAILADLHQMGVKLWLDDFGTGFSGLSHLRKVPVDGLKIDRSFVADLPQDHYDLALTSAIIAMARSLNIAAVAEGIETRAQYEVLRAMRCDMGQGYALSEALSAPAMAELLSMGRMLDVAA